MFLEKAIAGELSYLEIERLLLFFMTSIVLYCPGPGIDRGHFYSISLRRPPIEYLGGLSSIVDFIGS